MTFPAVTPIAQPAVLPYRDNAWYGTDTGNNPTTTIALLADTAYCWPILIRQPTTVRRVATHIGTGVVASTLRVALYDSLLDGNGPRNLLVGSMTEYDMGQPANTPIELEVLPAIWRAPGFIWAVARGAGGPQPFTMPHNTNNNNEFARWVGAANARNVNLAVGGGAPTRLTFALPYADPWPLQAPAAGVSSATPGSVVFAWRRN